LGQAKRYTPPERPLPAGEGGRRDSSATPLAVEPARAKADGEMGALPIVLALEVADAGRISERTDHRANDAATPVRFRVVLLPGSVLPAELAYRALVDALGDTADALVKDLELYASDDPPDGYGLEREAAGVLQLADRRGWDEFHLVGYSAGGAAALVLAATRPERLLSVALLEPAWAGAWEMSAAERAVWREFMRLEALPPDALLSAFVRAQLAPGVEPPAPPDGEAPVWMAKRPAGIKALMQAFAPGVPDRAGLCRFTRPVYFALGGPSNQDDWGEMAARLRRVFADFELEVFGERHHFDPPHRAEPSRLARSLTALWRRAEASEHRGPHGAELDGPL
jgi:pimeloyl-ACP methyl ester carboxylesterase